MDFGAVHALRRLLSPALALAMVVRPVVGADLRCEATLEMYDAYGDGWGGNAKWTWTRQTGGEVVSSGTLQAGSSGTAELCGVGECFWLEVSDDTPYPSDISWSVVIRATGAVEATGGAGDRESVCIVASPTLQPSVSLVPTVSMSPTQTPTSRPVIEVSNFLQLKTSIANDVILDLMNDVTVTGERLLIYGIAGLTIKSDSGARVVSDRSFDAEYGGIIGASYCDITLIGFELVNGKATSNGGCVYMEGGSMTMVDMVFRGCESGGVRNSSHSIT